MCLPTIWRNFVARLPYFQRQFCIHVAETEIIQTVVYAIFVMRIMIFWFISFYARQKQHSTDNEWRKSRVVLWLERALIGLLDIVSDWLSLGII